MHYLNDFKNFVNEDIYYIYRPLATDFTNLPLDKFILVNCASEHYGQGNYITNLHSTLDRLGVDFLITSHLPDHHLINPRLVYYPYWYHWSIDFFTRIYLQNLQQDSKKYKISCLNHLPRPHRLYNYFLLKNKSYFDHCISSMYSDDCTDVAKRSDDYAIPQEVVDWWAKHNFDFKSHKGNGFDNNLVHDAYTNAYINLITETTVIPGLFITEKTWKPIASGQLFLILGNPGSIEYLRNQGVDVFDDIIDHNYYDHEQDFETRLVKLHQVLDQLVELDLETLNINTKARRLTNAERFYAGEFNTNYLEFYDHIRKYI